MLLIYMGGLMTVTLEKKLVAELLGTFFLVLFGTGSAVITLLIADSFYPGSGGIGFLGGLGDWIAIGLVFGLTAMVCIYAFGRISGAHFNPAVSIALVINKCMPLRDCIYYIVAQCVGAVLGSIALYLCLGMPAVTIGGLGATTPGMGVSYFQAMFAEFLGTMFLVLIIMAVAVDKKAEPRVGGIVVGSTIAAVIAVLGAFTGASINPARTFGPYLMDSLLGGSNLWVYFPIYVVGPILGGVVAALIYSYIAKNNKSCQLY